MRVNSAGARVGRQLTIEATLHLRAWPTQWGET
jgi:hypothetical protein